MRDPVQMARMIRDPTLRPTTFDPHIAVRCLPAFALILGAYLMLGRPPALGVAQAHRVAALGGDGRDGLRAAACVAAALLATRALGLAHGYWTPITAMAVLKPGVRDTWSRGAERLAAATLCIALVGDRSGPVALLTLAAALLGGLFALAVALIAPRWGRS